MSQSEVLYLSAIVCGIAALMVIAQALGFDLRLAGKPVATSTETRAARFPSKATLRVAFALCFLSCVFAGIGWYEVRHRGLTPIRFDPKFNSFVEVRDRKFRNEVVPLDGHSCVHCTFMNVQFSWNGTAPFQLKNNDVFGFVLSSDSDAINATVLLLKGTHMLK